MLLSPSWSEQAPCIPPDMLHSPSLHSTAVPRPLSKLSIQVCVEQKSGGGLAGSEGGQSFSLVTPDSVGQENEPVPVVSVLVSVLVVLHWEGS